MIRQLIVAVLVLLVTLLIVPATMAQFMTKDPDGQAQEEPVELESVATETTDAPVIQVDVYRTGSQTIETIPLESYIRGVVASEMPVEFELEALKAQALAARTYIIRRMVEQDFADTPEGSVVTDTVKHQVYQSEEELREQWGRDYEQNISQVNKAINETEGHVLTYEGQPIDATFFSTSNGYTENSEEYWNQEIPYLRSVESPWDESSPRFLEQLEMDIHEFEQKLDLELTVPAGTGEDFSEQISTTTGNRVGEIQIGDQVFSGREVREALGLSSSDFEWRLNGGTIQIETSGFGHGVGMSQWGANGMAQEGYSAEEIVQYYYQDIDIQDYREWVVQEN